MNESADLLVQAAIAKQRRKENLIAALTGRQPRDDRGRFGPAPAEGFDGGARRDSMPLAAESHEATLSRVLRDGSADVGRHF